MTRDDPKLQLICFDIGGVLVRTHSDWEKVLTEVGVEHASRVAPRIVDGPRDPIIHAYETGKIDTIEFFLRTAKLLEVDTAIVRRVMIAWLVSCYEGFDALLDRLDAAGVATACLSNTNAFHWELMAGRFHVAIPLARLTYRFASHRIGVMKPNPLIYERVEQESGVEPSRIAFYDDREINIEGARKRGWHTLEIDPDGDTIAQITADLVAQGALR